MNITELKSTDLKKEYKVSIPVKDVDDKVAQRLNVIGASATIQGFRKGKAPIEVLKKQYGQRAWAEAAEQSVQEAADKVINDNKLKPAMQPQIEVETFEQGKDIAFKMGIEVTPPVKLMDFAKIAVTRRAVKVTDADINETLDNIRNQQKDFVDAPKTAKAKMGDTLVIDFEGDAEGVGKLPGMKGEGASLTLGSNQFIPGFEEKIIGMKAGAEKEFELKFPEKYFDKKMAGKTAEFKVKCNSVFEIELPELNDAFASSVSADKFKTVAEVKKNVLENLKAEEGGKQEQKVEIEMLDKLVDISEFEAIPDLLIDNEVHKMVHELEHSISNQGFNFADYLKSLNKTEEDLKTEFRPQAEKRVKISILAREIYVQEKFEVRDDEIEAEIEVVMQNYPNNEDVRKQLETETYKDYLKNTIGNRKVIEFLKKEIIVK